MDNTTGAPAIIVRQTGIRLPCICATPYAVTGHLFCPAHGVRLPPPIVWHSTSANP